MRTNVEIDDELMAKAMKATGARTKREAIEESMKIAVRLSAQRKILELWGSVPDWQGDLDQMRGR